MDVYFSKRTPVPPVLIGILLILISQTESQAQVCTCDLTENSCDPNCCCDPDCTDADKNSFTVCLNADMNQDDRVCLSDNVILFNNAKYRSQGTGSGLFCIYKDNFADRNFYTTVQSATDNANFESLAAKYRKSSFQSVLPETPAFTSSSKYKVGDKVLLLFQSDVAGFLALPKPLSSSECNDKNPAGFLQNEESSCSRQIRDLPSQCTADRSFNALSYFTGFRVVPSPAFLANVILQRNISASSSVAASSDTTLASQVMTSIPVAASSSVVPSNPVTASVNTSNITSSITANVGPGPIMTTTQTVGPVFTSTALVNVTVTQPVLCLTNSGVTGTCGFTVLPSPSYDFQQNICNNVVLKASYVISYIEGSSLNISSVTVSFTLGNIKAARKSFRQDFSVAFKKNSSGNAFKRSGNPGYVIGQPLLAGTLVRNTQQNKDAIQLSTDSAKWLTIVRPGTDSACSNSTQRSSVTFGKSVRSGCYVSVKRTMTVAECTALQTIIFNALFKDLPTHVAMFGNSAVTNVADWIKIIDVKPTNTPSVLNGECQNMVLGLQYEVLHSRTGFLANPQQKIVGVRVKYESSRSITYQCAGPYCQPGSPSLTRRVDIVQSVSFVDVSASLEAKEKSKPDFTSKAPYDFFFPFV